MVDVHTPEQRSYNMSRIRGKWTKPEIKLHGYLKGHKIKHRMHPNMYGNPDVYIKDINTVIFVDGCFWHGCPKHGHMTKSNKKFWAAKIDMNKKRDRKNRLILRKMGYNVVRLWEHEIKDMTKIIYKIS